MKLRLRDNTLRLRLTQPEVARLGETGYVEAQTCFGSAADDVLTYALRVSDERDTLTAEWNEGHMTVYMPTSMAEAWTRTGVTDGPVGFEAEQRIGDGETLYVLVEKDFKCLTDRKHPEDDAGTYSHPREGEATC